MAQRITKYSKIACFFLCIYVTFAQVEKPAKWTVNASKTKAHIDEVITIKFEVAIKDGWYMYSIGAFEAAPATTIQFTPNDSYELVGSTVAVGDKFKKDPYIGDYKYFTRKALFTQKIRVKRKNLLVEGVYEYSTCSIESGVCLPPKDETFSISNFVITDAPADTSVSKKLKTSEPKSGLAEQKTDSTASAVISELPKPTRDTASISSTHAQIIDNVSGNRESLWSFFILAFVSGLVALLTPCVFPMIPMTVTFFLNSSKTKSQAVVKAGVYGFSIIVIYTFIGTLVAKVAGPEAANFLSTHWLPNLFFFAVFVLFALSFLGLFEITLPAWLVNAADRQSEKGGYAGIFFMAFTLVLVSFSCTGPIIGTILVQSAGGAFLRPMIGMFGFSLAFAVPFTLFAIFPNWLKTLPKSGGWLNSVKVVLGFLELALSLKFLSLADQAYHWRILDRDVQLALWIAIFGAMSLYLFGLITLPHDTKLERIGVWRLTFAILTLAFTIYLVPGLFGAPLKPLSGYLPPMSTLDFKPTTATGDVSASESGNICETPRYSKFLELPHGIKGYFDYKEAVACARKLRKPLFINFTGHGCVNCREMEANVWSDPQVLKKLKNDFVVVALYVDDKTELPESDWYTSTYDQKVKKSIGKQNADFQITRFNNNAQPYYIILDPEENILAGPRGYNLNVEEFLQFLDVRLPER